MGEYGNTDGGVAVLDEPVESPSPEGPEFQPARLEYKVRTRRLEDLLASCRQIYAATVAKKGRQAVDQYIDEDLSDLCEAERNELRSIVHRKLQEINHSERRRKRTENMMKGDKRA